MLKDEISFAKTRDIYVQVYREAFTQEEVNSIVSLQHTSRQGDD